MRAAPTGLPVTTGGALTVAARVAGSLRVNAALVRGFRRSPPDFIDVLVRHGRGRGPLRFGPERVLLVDDPGEAWELLTTHVRRTGKGRGLVRARLLLGDGLLTSEGDAHLRRRRLLQPAFHPEQVAGYRSAFVGAARRTARDWSEGRRIDLTAEMSTLTLDAAGSALFGSDLREPAPRIVEALTDVLASFRLVLAPGGGWLIRSALPAAVRFRSARAELDRVVDDLLRRGRADRAGTAPLLDLLAQHPELGDQQIRDEVITLLLAGHETTATALTWALAAVDGAPAVRAELEAEWDAWAAASSPAADPVEALPLTTAVVAESLRLWPPSWMFTRRVRQPIVLGGRAVAVGTLCLVSPALLHRDPRWWSDPDRFLPGRWLQRPPDGKRRFDARAPGQPRGAFLPFGAGPRMCVGEQFAWSETAVVLAELGRFWRVRVHQSPLKPGPSSMTLRPRPPVSATTERRPA